MDGDLRSLESLFAAVDNVHTIRYFSLAASVVVFYDLIILADQEIDRVWRAPWSRGNILYFINKYYTLSAAVFNNYSLHWFQWQGATGIIIVAITEVILSLRLYALWALDKRILAIIIVSFTASLTVSATLVAYGMQHISASSNAIPGLPFCTRTVPPRSFFHFWFPILFSESVLFGLAIWRGFQTYHHLMLHKKNLFDILIRDSILYFLAVFATYLAGAIVFVAGTDTQMECVIPFTVSMASVMGNRLCLNIRSMNHGPEDNDETLQNAIPDLTYDHTMPCLKTQDDRRALAQCDNVDIEASVLPST